jgi:hypothetical protein
MLDLEEVAATRSGPSPAKSDIRNGIGVLRTVTPKEAPGTRSPEPEVSDPREVSIAVGMSRWGNCVAPTVAVLLNVVGIVAERTIAACGNVGAALRLSPPPLRTELRALVPFGKGALVSDRRRRIEDRIAVAQRRKPALIREVRGLR